MEKVKFQNYEFDSLHEATCAALFTKYGWKWEQPSHAISGWHPDFLLKGDTNVYVECKGGLKWDDVPGFKEIAKYEDSIKGRQEEVLLIPDSPRSMKNKKGFPVNLLGFLFDGSIWSYAELGRWSGKVGFSHSGGSWRDRMSGEDVKRPDGNGKSPEIEMDWLSAKSFVGGKRISFFKGFNDSEVETWEPSSSNM